MKYLLLLLLIPQPTFAIRAIMEKVAASNNSIYVDTNTARVGISTATPQTTLDVAGSAQFGQGATKSTFTANGSLFLAQPLGASSLVSTVAYTNSSSNNWTLGALPSTVAYTNIDNKFSAGQTINGQETITSSFTVQGNAAVNGTIGIGTAVMTSTLNVAGVGFFNNSLNTEILLNSAGANFGKITNSGTGVWNLGYGANVSGVETSVLTWNSSGNAGINTTAPNDKLSVVGAISASGAELAVSTGVLTLVSSNADVRPTIAIRQDGSQTYGFNIDYDDVVAGNLIFRPLVNGTVGIPLLTLTRNGTGVGVNTTSPNTILDTKVATNQHVNFYQSTDPQIAFLNDATSGIQGRIVGNPLLLNPTGNSVAIGTTSFNGKTGDGTPDISLVVPNAFQAANANGKAWTMTFDSAGSYLDASHTATFRVNGASSLTNFMTVNTSGNANFNIVIATQASASGDVFADCPSGKYALSGGCNCAGGTNSGVTEVRNVPVSAAHALLSAGTAMPTAWYCRVSGTNTPPPCSAYVVCSTISP